MTAEKIVPDKKRKDLIATLKQAQAQYGYISEDVIAETAKSLDLTVGDVYGVATFYSFLSVKPKGRHTVRVCKSLPCHMKDPKIIETVAKALGIKPGETTPDGRFSLELTNCIGGCDAPPAMLIDGDLHNDLTLPKITEILKKYT